MQRPLTDTAKVVAAIAVVAIHATSTAETRFAAQHNYISLDFIGVALNQWARFSVPLFLYLSAYGLAKSTKEFASGFWTNYAQFLKKRLATILLPYFFFSAVPIAMEIHSYGENTPFGQLWNSIATKLLTGTADYHLYFLVILLQCYLLFPLLLQISRKFPVVFRSFTWISFILVVTLLYRGTSEWVLSRFGLSNPGWHASFAIYWLPYFCLGILHVQGDPSALLRKSIATAHQNGSENTPAMEIHSYWTLQRFAFFCLVLFTLLLVILDYNRASWQGIPVDYYNHFSRPSVALYTLAVLWFLHSFSVGMFTKENAVSRLAPLTFTVYLLHPHILRVVNNYIPYIPSIAGWILVTITTFVLVYFLHQITKWFIDKENKPVKMAAHFLQRSLGLR